MDVSLSCRCTIAVCLICTAGCMNPGYQTLHPPGFSSTALRVDRHRRNLSDLEFAQLIGQPIPESTLTDPGKAQMANHDLDPSHPLQLWLRLNQLTLVLLLFPDLKAQKHNLNRQNLFKQEQLYLL